jgi:antirestriction protein
MILQDYSFIELNSNISNEDEKVGYGYIDEVVYGVENLPREVLERYFDFEAYGRDLRLNGGCVVKDDIMVLN